MSRIAETKSGRVEKCPKAVNRWQEWWWLYLWWWLLCLPFIEGSGDRGGLLPQKDICKRIIRILIMVMMTMVTMITMLPQKDICKRILIMIIWPMVVTMMNSWNLWVGCNVTLSLMNISTWQRALPVNYSTKLISIKNVFTGSTHYMWYHTETTQVSHCVPHRDHTCTGPEESEDVG